VTVTKVDSDGKRVTTSDGETVSYNHIVLATGGKPTRIAIDGKDLEGVLTLRHVGDAKTINSLVSKVSDNVIIGTGFIEIESRGALIRRRRRA
jgi:NAD(P)H-nitrite reductase large subunit